MSQVYEASSAPLNDMTVLGVRGRDLCESVPVFWIYPVSETDNLISMANFSTYENPMTVNKLINKFSFENHN